MRNERIEIEVTPGVKVPMDMYCPEVTWEIDENIQRPAVIVFAGGGYSHICHRETEPVALDFAAHGFNAFVLWYRVSPDHFPSATQDAGAAVAWVRKHAEQTHTHPQKIAVLGFSAGGHCAASLGILWHREDIFAPVGLTPEQVRPNAMVLGYPVITAGEAAHRESFVYLTGSEDLREHERCSLEKLVDEKTVPVFVWHTWEDELVPVENTLLLLTALRRYGIPAQAHIYPHGRHGSSLCRAESSGVKKPYLNLPECEEWPEKARSFLKDTMRG